MTFEITVEFNPFPNWPIGWRVMEDGVMTWSLHDTKEEAEVAAIDARKEIIMFAHVDKLLDGLRDQLMVEFDLTVETAEQLIADSNNGESRYES